MSSVDDSTVYRIAKWDEVFETAESRRHKNLTWVSMPIGFTSHGYQSLIDEFGDDAPGIYGAWCALVSLASTMPTRGTLASSRGIPLSRRSIARLTFFPQEVYDRLFEWATRPDIKWIVTENCDDSEGTDPSQNEGTDPSKTPAQATPSQRPGDAQANTGLPNITQHNKTLPNNNNNQGGVGGGGEESGIVLGKAEFDRVTTESVGRLAEQLGPHMLRFSLTKQQRGMIARLTLAAGVRSEVLELAQACGAPSTKYPSRYWAAGLPKIFAGAGVDYAASEEQLKQLIAQRSQPVGSAS